MIPVIQVIIALAIFNVWLFRFHKPTAWRGGGAQNMVEEFRVYGLPEGFVKVIGFFKLLFAGLLIVGIWIPGQAKVAAIGMAVLMPGAVSMHLKVKDPFRRAVPALTLLILCVIVASN